MDGRKRFSLKMCCATVAAGLLMAIGASSTYGQAMGKAAVDASAARPAARTIETPVVAAAEPARPVSLPVVAAADPLLQTPASVAEVVKTPSPAPKAEAVAVPAGDATPAAEVSGADAKKSAVSDIEDQRIHKSASTNAASNEAKTLSGGKTNLLPSGLGNAGQVAAALAIVVGLIFIGRGLVRKFVPGARTENGKGVIEILARHPLTKNQSIVLVRIGSQIVALNQGRESSESVLVINDATEVARIIGQIEGKNPNSISAGFNNLLANARMDLEENGDADAGEKSIDPEGLDEQLEEMAAAKRQLMELRQHVRSVRDRMPST